jgi:dCTP deaminase
MVADAVQGILPAQAIEELVARGAIRIARALDADQVQPASLDLRLGYRAYRIRASFLPGPNATVADRLQSLALHEIDLSRGAVLETGCVYLVELMEGLALRDGVSATANPKSSTGRLDVFTRVILDRAQAVDTIPAETWPKPGSKKPA